MRALDKWRLSRKKKKCQKHIEAAMSELVHGHGEAGRKVYELLTNAYIETHECEPK